MGGSTIQRGISILHKVRVGFQKLYFQSRRREGLELQKVLLGLGSGNHGSRVEFPNPGGETRGVEAWSLNSTGVSLLLPTGQAWPGLPQTIILGAWLGVGLKFVMQV